MSHTHFVNCCGLDDPQHYTSAGDIAIMSQELMTDIPRYSTTAYRQGRYYPPPPPRAAFAFTQSNTNRLLKQYPYATGLKTGSTSQAKF